MGAEEQTADEADHREVQTDHMRVEEEGWVIRVKCEGGGEVGYKSEV